MCLLILNGTTMKSPILEALLDERYPEGRTVRGIANDTGISQYEVRKALYGMTYRGKSIMVHPKRNQYGEKIYTTKQNFRKNSSWVERLLHSWRI
jgi:hypothetical protein